MAKTANPDEKVEKDLEEFMDTVRPPTKVREQRIAGLEGSEFEKFDKIYEQRRLSFFGKLEFTRTVKRFLDDDERLAELIAQLRASDNDERISALVQLVLTMVEQGPETAKQIFMQALNVPEQDRWIVSGILDQPHDDDTGQGGLNDDDAMAIIETFVDQNAKAMRDLFFDRMRQLGERVQEILSQTQDSSTPSKRTRRNTPRR